MMFRRRTPPVFIRSGAFLSRKTPLARFPLSPFPIEGQIPDGGIIRKTGAVTQWAEHAWVAVTQESAGHQMHSKEVSHDYLPELKGGLELDRDPSLALLTADNEIIELATSLTHRPWRLEHRSDSGAFTDLLRSPGIKLVVLDDDAATETDRGWLLAQIRRNVPDAMLLYIAGNHTSENEKRARAGGAHFYTSKPIPYQHLASVMKSFMDLHK